MITTSSIESFTPYAADGEKVIPEASDYNNGSVPLDSLPAVWWNALNHRYSANIQNAKTDLNAVIGQLNACVSAAGLEPATAELVAALKLLPYPVGSIYMCMDALPPSAKFGGTWEQISQGRVLVGEGKGNDSKRESTFTVNQSAGFYDLQMHTHANTVNLSGGSVAISGTTGTQGGTSFSSVTNDIGGTGYAIATSSATPATATGAASSTIAAGAFAHEHSIPQQRVLFTSFVWDTSGTISTLVTQLAAVSPYWKDRTGKNISSYYFATPHVVVEGFDAYITPTPNVNSAVVPKTTTDGVNIPGSNYKLPTHTHTISTAHTHTGYLPVHAHTTYLPTHSHSFSGTANLSGASVSITNASAGSGALAGTAGGNMQPFLVCYIWQRTA